MVDFIIVGRGLAANVLAHTFYKAGLSFKVIGNEQLSNCSRVAAGIWNPVVFKRLSPSWLAHDLIPFLNTFYSECEATLGKKLITQRPIIKPFTEDQEKSLWQKKAAAALSGFLDPDIHEDLPPALEGCIIQNGYGVVKNAGNLNVPFFLTATASFFKNSFVDETFDHALLQVLQDKVIYKTITARNIVFCEGHLVQNNPFFGWIPLKPAKGEVFTISSNNLQMKDTIFNRNGFLMDLEDGTFKAGATYEWNDLTDTPTEKGALELHDKLKQITGSSYTVVKHEAGIRPSSIDRRPVIGPHPLHSHLFVFNGLGTKGVMLAPFFAGKFVNFCLDGRSLNAEVNVERFYHLYECEKKT